MAIRNALHKSKLSEFEKWLEEKNYMIIPTLGEYEVLRAKHNLNGTIIVYTKANAKEHYSVADKDYHIVKEFFKKRWLM